MGTDTLLAQLRSQLPLRFEELTLPSHKVVGLVVVDEVNGFCTVGCGNLAPPAPDKQISQMVDETVELARQFSARGWPNLCFLDTHRPDKLEPPYPPHCITGTGEENLIPALTWLEKDENVLLMRKDCINGFIGGMQIDGSNVVVDWVKQNHVEICNSLTGGQWSSRPRGLYKLHNELIPRNHGILEPLEEVVVCSSACATFDLPTSLAKSVGAIPHPQEVTHYMGLYFAMSRGARLADKIVFKDVPRPVD